MKAKLIIKLFSAIIIVLVLSIGLIIFLIKSGVYNPGANRQDGLVLPPGNMEVPVQRSYVSSGHSALRQELLDYWCARSLPPLQEKLIVTAPRILLACLITESRLGEVNAYIRSLKPNGVSGSSWRLNPHGDYDFTQMALIPMIYKFDDRPDILYPETRDHLVNVMIVEKGDRFNTKVPRTFGLVEDTENHILMTEGTRYLMNKWLVRHGETDPLYDNQKNGMEDQLAAYLEEMVACGIYEFNSDPYLGYTLSALLNLEAFADGPVQHLSRKLLDRMNWQYALGSFNLRRHPPIRRQYRKHTKTELNRDYHTAAMKTWLSFYADILNIDLDLHMERGKHIALWAAIMPYRPADAVIDWTLAKPEPYLVKMGHGSNSCPEIYSGDPSFLLSAGGANQGRRSLILPRPIILFSDDHKSKLSEVFHMMGPGEDFMNWNNTGVHDRFAVAAGPVRIPAGKNPLHVHENWSVFELSTELLLAAFSTPDLGIMAIIDGEVADAEEKLKDVIADNPETKLLDGKFVHRNGTRIAFNATAPRNLWVITSINNQMVNRKFETWAAFTLYQNQ